ncbi:MAG: hypothetical protein A3G49_02685 [Candidatus Sungbacteria bacterium RIFCSPLOWO2_12_FULL_41_11]|uniref:Non-canonical purine NTP pyrophosphatase n=1 Tax=Candidatus Sungbacteria bacterium RIFCSPLOWO2_12_FULL_41_11 TaxID=1802286 RepID=A0A1G2LRF6_9BACT|nr:MAG: Ham1 family protein [Parcubacteria group bacterium GW2011_GWA2_42_14]OHA00212.1 MAG: hypothetical protein A3D41_01965 [Candidatus Sungbacteria bacterium RIFCSPHIGHO2_02_FULL_41_12b]OHA14123.1 MAG: hypothetical protein A3G49_02685 [Candidatus Sungbacteria bacterium RIFCSPLOWO2_12_FULL_41_11]
MTEIRYATTNQAKVLSLKRRIEKYAIKIIQIPLKMPEPRSYDVEEIAKAKIEFAYKQIRKPVVVLDAGFYIPSLNGFPRAFVNFALDTIDIEGILKLVENKPRSCEFVECLAYHDASLSEPKLFTAKIKGELSDSPAGTIQPHQWSKLSLIFIPLGHDKTLAEMSKEEYLNWSDVTLKESASKMFIDWFIKSGNYSG